KRKVYEYAVYDFRSARKLQPQSKQINTNLARATAAWKALLYNNIEGYKREIAIDPSVPVNYLSIGKSYKHLGKWGLAEEWYDKYLTMEEASSDEIIRYSEILAKNGHIKKGEPILKRYTVKYPKDQRLWSRYGYFVLWLGKNKTAIDAFENALTIRPYFKEALDGLDRAKGKPYIYSINDTSVQYRNGRIVRKRTKRFEYHIDRYYRLLKRKPNDNALRFTLINALVKVERFVEAEAQLKTLTENGVEPARVETLTAEVVDKKESVIQIRIAQYSKKIKLNPTNKAIVLKLAEYYAGLSDYDSALEILTEYLNRVPGTNPEIRFLVAKDYAWNYDFDGANEEMEILLNEDPSNLEYQLYHGQILTWWVRDLDQARIYLENVLKHNANNIDAIVSMISLNSWQKDFPEAKKYLDLAKNISPNDNLVITSEQFYERALSANEGLKILQIRAEAGVLAESGDCVGAVSMFEEYLQKITGPTKQELMEYGDLLFCAKDFDKAVSIYDQILSEEYDYDIAFFRARALLETNDSTEALKQFQKLAFEQPKNFNTNLYLGEAYSKMHEYDKAEDVYTYMLEHSQDSNYVQLDSSQIKIISARLGWLPVSGFNKLFSNFPSYISMNPLTSYFSDNQDFSFNTFGLGLQFGITNFMSAGILYKRIRQQSLFLNNNLTSFEGQIKLRLSNNISASVGLGTLENSFGSNRNIYNVVLRAEEDNKYSIIAMFENTDGRLVLSSPFLIGFTNYDVNYLNFNGYYLTKSGVKIAGNYNYISVSDGNVGNNILLSIGKKFYRNLFIGYEYAYSNYKFDTPLYYTPQNYDSHSLWLEWIAKKSKELNLNLGGKIGYSPSVDFLLRELYVDIAYRPFVYFTLNARIGATSSYRFTSSYNSVNIVLSLYWSIF
ncbi:MAG: tetratricopeptide repeat protein, partial [Bacteroidetes bacterium]|nr:tetratricopeptide repeat protein [Bacteroidota bacterium]